MKYNNTTDLKNSLEERWKEQDDFIEKLMKDFPDLFPQDENGNTLPPVCASGISVGWNDIVYKLCAILDYRCKNSYRMVRKTDFKSKVFFLRDKITHKIFVTYVNKILDPYRPYRPKGQKAWMIPNSVHNQIIASRRFKIQSWFSKFNRKYFSYEAYEEVYPPKITIQQIKEKFGGLRFYYSGGDDQAQGAVNFAEYLCSLTCEETGNAGVLCQRKGWYRTLSLDIAKKLEYTPVNETLREET